MRDDAYQNQNKKQIVVHGSMLYDYWPYSDLSTTTILKLNAKKQEAF